MAKMINEFIVTIGGNRTIAEIIAESDCVNYSGSIIERCVLTLCPRREVTMALFGIEEYDHNPTEAEIKKDYILHDLKYLTIN